tara:strand:- start:3206 stop:4111 length:906 start_codon:yes stop_codon:yes gene_type:complete
MASLIKTNKLSTPGGQEFTLPTTLPASQSSLTSTAAGQLSYGSLGFSSDAMVGENFVKSGEKTSTAHISSEILIDKARIKHDSTASQVTLSVKPSTFQTGTQAQNIQMIRLNFDGVNFSDGGFYPSIQLLDSSNNNIITNSSANQAMRSWANVNGGMTQYSNDPNVAYCPMLYSYSYRPTGAYAASELFNQNTRRNGSAMMNGYVEVMLTSSAANQDDGSSSSSWGAGGHILIKTMSVFRHQSSYDNTDNNATQRNFNIFSSKQTNVNNMEKIKFYSYNGTTVMNEGLFWTESMLNPFRTV